jgi:deoxyribodipyrimidine photo-lyase
MQQSQRVHFNHALEEAILFANAYQLPLVVYFGLTANYPEANLRHYQFMLEGLKEVKKLLEQLHIQFYLKFESPEKGILPLLSQAQVLVMDQGYLKHQRYWRDSIIQHVKENHQHLTLECVDTDAIVPVHIASNKSEYGAYTIRPKIKRLYMEFRDFKKLSTLKINKHIDLISDDELSDINITLQKLKVDHQVGPSPLYKGGYLEASKLFLEFIEHKANHYLESNDPSLSYTSKLSMYIHFGQISTLDILERMYMALEQNHIDGASFDAFIEQLLVRRELALNYVTYTQGYDDFHKMTENWAYLTMKEHESDPRIYLYNQQELEHSQTHDPYFNAAMKEMFYTGYMHNYMRMYWAKKIIEWSSSFKEAYDIISYLNNKYFIDGRDANSYAGIAWCFGKHDRAWNEREIFGKLRYMNALGLERKFNIKKYVKEVEITIKSIN